MISNPTDTFAIADENRVYSVLEAPVNLLTVQEVLKEEFPEASVRVYTSSYNGAKTIHLADNNADFEGYPKSVVAGSESDYFFNGSIDGGIEAAIAKAQRLFACVMDAGITYQYEVYDPAGSIVFEQRRQITKLPDNA